MSSSNNSKRFKVLVVGCGGVGKTALVATQRTGQFLKNYVATIGVDVSPLVFNTDQGEIRFDMWDCAGQPQFSGLRDGYYIEAHACILMFDVTCRETYKKIPEIYNSVKKVCGDIPMVMCGSKSDCVDRKVYPMDITINRWYDIPYYDISSRTSLNVEKLFLYLLRKLSHNHSLTLKRNDISIG